MEKERKCPGSEHDAINIHTKLWDAKLCEALVTKHMKPKIVKACSNIQIGGIPKASSVEHLVTLKTWMKTKESSKEGGIIQIFDMEKFFERIPNGHYGNTQNQGWHRQ